MSDAMIHSSALCESPHIGSGTRIWAFSHVLPGARIGQDCNICDHVFVENDVVVGNRVTVKCGVQLWDGVRIEDDVFIGPNATFTNDEYPRSKKYPLTYAPTTVCFGASIGANATILPGLIVGEHAMVGAGSVVTRSVPPKAIVVGNPARIVGYTDAHRLVPTQVERLQSDTRPVRPSSVRNVTLHQLHEVKDMRGNLSVAEFGTDVPFSVKRHFLVYDVPSLEVRGEHAHRNCKQFLIAIKGSVHVVADDGENREEFILENPSTGLYLPPMVWGVQCQYSVDAMLLVLASEHYDSTDYIRNYGDFIDEIKLTPHD